MKRVGSLALPLFLLLACSESFDSAGITVTHRDPGVPYEADREQVSAGGAVTVEVRPEGRSEYSGTVSVRIDALDPGIATIQQTILSDRWTILGRAPGLATFRVYVDGTPVETFEFRVIEFEGVAR